MGWQADPVEVKEIMLFEGGSSCPHCQIKEATLVNVDSLSTPFSFCNKCGVLTCAQCGWFAFRTSECGKTVYSCPVCSKTGVYIFLPFFPDGELVHVTASMIVKHNLHSKEDMISYALSGR